MGALLLLNDLQSQNQSNVNRTQIKQLQDQIRKSDTDIIESGLKLNVAKQAENATTTKTSDNVLQATEATNVVNVDKEMMAEELQSKEMKKELDTAEREEVAAEALGKEEKKTMQQEE